MTIHRIPQPGTPGPSALLRADALALFLFSVATRNPHRVHYDKTWATDVEGLQDVVVHGPLHAARFSALLEGWMPTGSHILTFRVRQEGAAFVNEDVRYESTVERVVDRSDAAEVTVSLRARVGDRAVARAEAVVAWTLTPGAGPIAEQ